MAKIHYKFKTESIDQFKIILVLRDIKSDIINRLFKQAKMKLKRKHNINTRKGDPDILKQFYIEEKYLNLINTATTKQIRQIKKEVKKDKIEIMRCQVKRAAFIRDEKTEDWNCHILYEGIYNDKRFF